MPCTDSSTPDSPRWAARILHFVFMVLGLTGCQQLPPLVATPDAVPASSRPPAPAPSTPPGPGVTEPLSERPASLEQLKLHAARRLVTMNPGLTYDGETPEVLLAIPVLEVELHANGSVRRIEVLRHPRQAQDTTRIAIDAVRRAAPFGDVSHLPRPWKFTETFLFDDHRRFKPRTLD